MWLVYFVNLPAASSRDEGWTHGQSEVEENQMPETMKIFRLRTCSL
jgi:hypothetical protein